MRLALKVAVRFLGILTAAAPLPALAQENCSDLSSAPPIEYSLGQKLGVPNDATAKRLLDQLDYQRAVQMYLWALPAVGTEQYRLGDAKVMGGGSDDGKVGYLGSLLKSTLLHLTGNPDSMYIDYFFDTHNGPIALELPAELPGFLDDMWEMPVIDLIAPVSPSGKYLIVPPGWQGEAPEGFVIARPKTYTSWALLRGGVGHDGSTTAAVDTMKEHLKIYPMSEIGKPHQDLQFIDISDSGADRLPPDGLRYFEVLGGLVSSEHPNMQDPYVMGMLKGLGMEPGKPFQPDNRMKHILGCAADMGRAMASSIAFYRTEPRWRDRAFVQAFIGGSPEFIVDGASLHDARAFFFYMACGTSKLMTSTTPDVGQAYPSGVRDGKGDLFDGGKTYKLHLPPNIPAKLYWSITLYDTVTRSILENGTPAARISTFTGPVANADGSFDLYFGPKAPAGREKNFVQTVPGKGWFFLFRLYGPEQAYFDDKWKPDDLVEIKG
jgi:hypothetical protein